MSLKPEILRSIRIGAQESISLKRLHKRIASGFPQEGSKQTIFDAGSHPMPNPEFSPNYVVNPSALIIREQVDAWWNNDDEDYQPEEVAHVNDLIMKAVTEACAEYEDSAEQGRPRISPETPA